MAFPVGTLLDGHLFPIFPMSKNKIEFLMGLYESPFIPYEECWNEAEYFNQFEKEQAAMFLVTTDKNRIPTDQQIIMVDGTVPGWEPKEGDLHYDHHRPGGEPVQLSEIYEIPKISDNAVFITTQVDADACVAAAYILLCQTPPLIGIDVYDRFYAIAHDCDHLHVPSQVSELSEFAAKAVAALKEEGDKLATELGLPSNRKDWSEEQKIQHVSACFEHGTLWLVEAAKGNRPYPGESGEADEYFRKLEALRPKVYENCYLYRGVAVFDSRTLDEGYIDPRLMTDWARLNSSCPVTLTVRDGTRQPNASLVSEYEGDLYSYTLGSIPLHPEGSPKYSDRDIWTKLAKYEDLCRSTFGLPNSETKWGGRNEVGGSSWRDPMIMSPGQVLDVVLESYL
jgi:hypothetical protein